MFKKLVKPVGTASLCLFKYFQYFFQMYGEINQTDFKEL